MSLYTVVKPGRVFYVGSDRDTAVLRHHANPDSRLYCDHVLLSTRVSTTGTRAERLLRIEEGHEEKVEFTRVPVHAHRQPKER